MQATLSSHCVLAFGFLTCAGIVFAATGDAARPAYHTDAAEVRLTFFATDQNHHPVATISEGDFAVVDQDLVVRNFNSFSRAAWTSIEVAVVFDGSESVARQFKKEITNTLQLITRRGEIPEESFSLISFHGSGPTLICAGNCRTVHAEDQLPAAAEGLTPLFDSIVFAADVISRRAGSHCKKVLILFSDGEDTISRDGPGDAIAAALAQDIEIYGVDLNPSAHSPEGTFLLQKLAGASGGRYFVLQRDADQVFDAVLEDFRAAYTVIYRVPVRERGFHPVRLFPTHNLSLHFHCRSGYEYSGSQ